MFLCDHLPSWAVCIFLGPDRLTPLETDLEPGDSAAVSGEPGDSEVPGKERLRHPPSRWSGFWIDVASICLL